MVLTTEFEQPAPSDSPCELCDRQCPEACKVQQRVHGCHACDRIGCWKRSRACPFYNRNRPNHVDASLGDNVPHMNETPVQIFLGGAELLKGAQMQSHWRKGRDIVVKVDGVCFNTGSASGANMNCLIDTLRQVVVGGVECNVQTVRDRIERDFPEVRPGDFLELQSHWRAAITWLGRYNKIGAVFNADDFKVVCVDLLYVGNGDVIGCGTQTLYLARESQNHFVPLFQIQEAQTRRTELKLVVATRRNSVDAKISCVMDSAELKTILKDKSVNNIHSLSRRVKQLVIETFNNLLLNIVDGVGVELDQDDILTLRDVKITRDLPDIIKQAVKLDTDAVYVTHEDGSEQLVLDLTLLPGKDQEEFRTAWYGMSEKSQQDVARVMHRQFETHIAMIDLAMDPDDLEVLQADWSKRHFLQILQATENKQKGACHNFPFVATLWPQKNLEAYKQTWRQWSDEQREDAVAMMQASFRAYTIDLEIDEHKASRDSSLWNSWGLKGFKDAQTAVLAKVAAADFIFEPEVSIDMIQDAEQRKKAGTLKPSVTEDQEKLIKVEILNRRSALRQKLNNALNAAALIKYEKQLVEKEYWNVVMQVVEGNLVSASTQREAGNSGIETPPYVAPPHNRRERENAADERANALRRRLIQEQTSYGSLTAPTASPTSTSRTPPSVEQASHFQQRGISKSPL
jgi:hypothetical protein